MVSRQTDLPNEMPPVPVPLPDAEIIIEPIAATARSPAMSFSRRRTPPWVGWVVGLLLVGYIAMAFTGTLKKGVSFDEGLQLAAGYNIWLNGDFRIEGANGDLIKRWATLPYLVSRPAFPSHDDPIWRKSLAYELGDKFLFSLGNDTERLLQQGRAMMTLLGASTGLLVYGCARYLFGYVGGLFALIVFAFSPSMLAFGGIVSTDISITLLLTAATVCVWCLLHRIAPARLLTSIVCFGLLVLSKPSALAILPITAVMIGVKCLGGRPLIVSGWNVTRRFVRCRSQLLVFAGCVVLHALAGWAAIWMHYGFRYAASPDPADPRLELFQVPVRDNTAPALIKMIAWMKRSRLFPEGFRHGVDSLLANDDLMGGFMGGKWKIGGQPLFFPYAMWVKTRPALWIAFAMGLVGAIWVAGARPRKIAVAVDQAAIAIPSFYALTPYFVLIVCYLAIAMTDDLNIGHRHVLPIYPALYVLTGSAALLCFGQKRWCRAILVAPLVWIVMESFLVRPDYLAYFSPQAGGPRNGYKHLVDSSLDWGMELPGLKAWIDRHDPRQLEPLHLAYFGTDQPEHYGLRVRRLPGFFDRRPITAYGLTPGYYAISASLLQGVYTAAFGRWSQTFESHYQRALANVQQLERVGNNAVAREKLIAQQGMKFWLKEIDTYDNLRLARLCAWLRHQGDPPHHVGHSLFIWKLDYASLEAALNGPSPELTDDAPIYRPLRPLR